MRSILPRVLTTLELERGILIILSCIAGWRLMQKKEVSPLYSHSVESSLYSWSKDSINELGKKGGKIQTHKLNAVAYLWAIC